MLLDLVPFYVQKSAPFLVQIIDVNSAPAERILKMAVAKITVPPHLKFPATDGERNSSAAGAGNTSYSG
jgi:hypothetical protein